MRLTSKSYQLRRLGRTYFIQMVHHERESALSERVIIDIVPATPVAGEPGGVNLVVTLTSYREEAYNGAVWDLVAKAFGLPVLSGDDRLEQQVAARIANALEEFFGRAGDHSV